MTITRSDLAFLNSFYLSRFRIHLKAESELHLPEYIGSMLRGIFGKALRRNICGQQMDVCVGCTFRKECTWGHHRKRKK